MVAGCAAAATPCSPPCSRAGPLAAAWRRAVSTMYRCWCTRGGARRPPTQPAGSAAQQNPSHPRTHPGRHPPHGTFTQLEACRAPCKQQQLQQLQNTGSAALTYHTRCRPPHMHTRVVMLQVPPSCWRVRGRVLQLRHACMLWDAAAAAVAVGRQHHGRPAPLDAGQSRRFGDRRHGPRALTPARLGPSHCT